MAKKKQNLPTAYGEEKDLPSLADRVLVNTQHIFEHQLVNVDDSEEVKKTITTYFKLCQMDKVRPTLSGLGMILGGMTRNKLLKIASGQQKFACREEVAMAIQTIEMFDEAMLKEGLFPALASIFYFKNNYGYTDKSEVVTGTDELSDEEIEKRYREKHEIVGEQ